METSATIQFTLHAADWRAGIHVQLRRSGGRWIARADSPDAAVGIGTSPRAALAAALEPLGPSAVGALLADTGLLEPSVRLLQLERAAGA